MTRLMGFRAAMLCALAGVDLSKRPEHEAADWWGRFVAEMEAIGCVAVGENPETGEIEFGCPPEKLADAKRIVARYAAHRRPQ